MAAARRTSVVERLSRAPTKQMGPYRRSSVGHDGIQKLAQGAHPGAGRRSASLRSSRSRNSSSVMYSAASASSRAASCCPPPPPHEAPTPASRDSGSSLTYPASDALGSYISAPVYRLDPVQLGHRVPPSAFPTRIRKNSQDAQKGPMRGGADGRTRGVVFCSLTPPGSPIRSPRIGSAAHVAAGEAVPADGFQHPALPHYRSSLSSSFRCHPRGEHILRPEQAWSSSRSAPWRQPGLQRFALFRRSRWPPPPASPIAPAVSRSRDSPPSCA